MSFIEIKIVKEVKAKEVSESTVEVDGSSSTTLKKEKKIKKKSKSGKRLIIPLISFLLLISIGITSFILKDDISNAIKIASIKVSKETSIKDIDIKESDNKKSTKNKEEKNTTSNTVEKKSTNEIIFPEVDFQIIEIGE